MPKRQRKKIFGVRPLVSHVSYFFTLISREHRQHRTLGGGAVGMKTRPMCMAAGQMLRLGLESLGNQAISCRSFLPSRTSI